jgi:glutaminyl-peptide cyclotransferase
MKIYKFGIYILTVFFISCGGNQTEESTFNILIKEQRPSYTPKDILSISLENTKQKQADSVVYFIDQNRMGKAQADEIFTVSLENQKLGNRILYAKIFLGRKTETPSKDFIVLASERPVLYSYKIINEFPHDVDAYTQGLEFYGDYLYESTGQYGKSSLRKTNYKTGEVIKQVDLDPNYFGEGITILNNKIYQLTWRENVGFIYNLETLEKTGNFVYTKSEEGWGLCNDGKTIYKSDGTEKIWTLNPDNLTEENYIEIYTNTSRIRSVNELEWVEGKIYANIFQQNAIAIINPKNGAVEGVIDLSDLYKNLSNHQLLNPRDNVLNGIAYMPEEKRLFVTGKNWNRLFEIEIFEKQ